MARAGLDRGRGPGAASPGESCSGGSRPGCAIPVRMTPGTPGLDYRVTHRGQSLSPHRSAGFRACSRRTCRVRGSTACRRDRRGGDTARRQRPSDAGRRVDAEARPEPGGRSPLRAPGPRRPSMMPPAPLAPWPVDGRWALPPRRARGPADQHDPGGPGPCRSPSRAGSTRRRPRGSTLRRDRRLFASREVARRLRCRQGRRRRRRSGRRRGPTGARLPGSLASAVGAESRPGAAPGRRPQRRLAHRHGGSVEGGEGMGGGGSIAARSGISRRAASADGARPRRRSPREPEGRGDRPRQGEVS